MKKILAWWWVFRNLYFIAWQADNVERELSALKKTIEHHEKLLELSRQIGQADSDSRDAQDALIELLFERCARLEAREVEQATQAQKSPRVIH